MPFSSYDELQGAVADWMDRDDLSARVPDFIRLAEVKIARKLRTITVRATITISAYATPLPSGCAELRSLSAVGLPYAPLIEVGTPEMLADVTHHQAFLLPTSYPAKYVVAVRGGDLLISPVPQLPLTVEVTYFDALVPLGGSVVRNSVLDTAPDLYLYGALMEAAKYMEHDQRVETWKGGYDEAFSELHIARDRAEHGAGLEPMRLPVVF